ncbi:nuclear transport factor 2 family protein [Streptomyces sp. NBC_01549]|uniref:nuclear transport factor 2 family protein n=1 Tax=Streptomyces sp. NBC_01549 TaxID=2975874 RepID=UPI002251E46B|nr:nuclear transport factor 2 family protein [Streptomyces sp. NBC_01549]MCX4594888.1 nuclear transport factor 2 family protein [Streptomyces sp. NBC_01549]
MCPVPSKLSDSHSFSFSFAFAFALADPQCGALRAAPCHIPEGRVVVLLEAIRAWGRRVPDVVDFLVQNTHPGVIQLDDDIACGRAYVSEVGRGRDGRGGLNYAIYHDRYRRTGDGWKFAERVYEVRYEDASPLAGSPLRPAEGS